MLMLLTNFCNMFNRYWNSILDLAPVFHQFDANFFGFTDNLRWLCFLNVPFFREVASYIVTMKIWNMYVLINYNIYYYESFFNRYYPFKHQPHKLVKHTQTIRQQFADKLFECLTILWVWCLEGSHLTFTLPLHVHQYWMIPFSFTN